MRGWSFRRRGEINIPDISQHTSSSSQRGHKGNENEYLDEIKSDKDGYLEDWGVGESYDPQLGVGVPCLDFFHFAYFSYKQFLTLKVKRSEYFLYYVFSLNGMQIHVF